MSSIQRRIGTEGETTLHIAALADQEEFVKKLLAWMGDNNLITAQNVAENVTLTSGNKIGTTALNFAAAVGNVKIAEAMLDRNIGDLGLPNIATTVKKPMKPLLMAASLGHGEMVELLYPRTKMVGNEEDEIFIACVKNDLFGLKFKQENSKQSAANELLTKCLKAYKWDVDNLIETPEIPQALFEAAIVDNNEIVVKLIRFNPDILLTTDKDKSIFHIAVEKRHQSIFNLLKELGPFGDIVVHRTIENGNNILHLAAELAPQEKLNAISGAALQMQRELLWFKEVEKIVSPDYKEMKNKKGDTPYVLFAKKHEKLRRDGEKWMRDTANYSMVVAALIGSIMFAGLLVDGLNNNPHLFLAFTVSTAISLFGSSTSLIMFLSILTSRYSFEDFLVSLPVRLMIGVTSLYISIVAMMVSFATLFWLKNYNQRPVIFVVIGLCACVPIMDVLLKYRLVFDIFKSTFFRFRPQHRLLQDEIYNAPVRRSQSHAPADLASV
nr:hypothetical protein CFP56_47489 [Quercus suber]